MPDPKAPIPRQIRYIIGNEGCERFSFYGMRNILTVFLVTSLLTYLPEAERGSAAKEVFHTFVIGVYFFPLLGGWIADRFFGKYNTIFWLSLVYCLGQACLALFVDNRNGVLHRAGADRARVGRDQAVRGVVRGRPVRSDEQASREGRVRRVLLDHQFRLVLRVVSDADLSARASGQAIAFGIPGVLMFMSTVILWIARKQYVMLPPAPPESAFVSQRLPHGARLGHARARAGDHGRGGGDRVVPAHPEIRIRDRGLPGAGGGDRVRRDRRVDAARCGPRQASRRSDRRRARGVAGAGALRARDAVLVALRPESVDVGACRRTR